MILFIWIDWSHFTSADGKQDKELDVWLGKASAVKLALYHSVVAQISLQKPAKYF